MTPEPHAAPVGEPLGFPNCPLCPYVIAGPVRVCAECAARTLTPIADRHCPICSQAITDGQGCRNALCRDPDRSIESIAAVAMYTEPLNSLIVGLKTNPRLSRGRIMGRLVLGWLQRNVRPEDVGLLVANPTYSATGEPGHTEMVLAHASREDLLGEYPFATPPALVKAGPTAKSKSRGYQEKVRAAKALEQMLALPQGDASVAGKRIIVYDDVLTSGSQLDAAAHFLKAHGAASVTGLVLARAPWRHPANT